MLNAKALIGTHDVLFITLDTLRYDVAMSALRAGQTPFLENILPDGAWELRQSPATFTYAAHHAFFAGFLPTPNFPGPHPRLFAATFLGSVTTDENTFIFEAADIVTGLSELGYHTVCIGGVGFFNKLTALGRVLPELFAESHWAENLGVTERESTGYQVETALASIRRLDWQRRLFLFINISALHQPNFMYLPGASADSVQSQAAALAYVDTQLPRLFDRLQRRGPLLCIITSDHGTAYGEDGYWGHRVSHPVVWQVPYAEFTLPSRTG